MAAADGRCMADHLDLAKATLERHHSDVQKLMDQHHVQVLSILEGAKSAVEQTAKTSRGTTHSAWSNSPPALPSFLSSNATSDQRMLLPGVPVPPGGPQTPVPLPPRPSKLAPMGGSSERFRRISAINEVVAHLRVEAFGKHDDSLQQGRSMSEVSETTQTMDGLVPIPSFLKSPKVSCVNPVVVHPGHCLVAAQTTRHCFADVEAMKEKVRVTISAPRYNVQLEYKDAGIAQRIAKSHGFENITLAIIAVNALWMGLETDLNEKDAWPQAHPVFGVMENFFCMFFSIEIFIRFQAFKIKSHCLQDFWFIFDLLLVLLMALETWVLTTITHFVDSGAGSSASASNIEFLRLVRLLRLTRMARLIRLLKAMPELMILVKGMAAGFRSVCSTLGLMLIIIYIFSIVFRMMGKESSLEDLGFKSVPQAMLTLLVRGVLDLDLYRFTQDLAEVEVVYVILLYCFILVASVTVMNMLIGVLVEVVAVVSAVEKEQIEVNYVRKQLESLSYRIDENHDGNISRDEFLCLLETPEAIRALLSIDVDPVGIVDYTDYIFQDEHPLTFANFMEALLELRGSHAARVKDIVDLRKIVMEAFMRLEASVLHFNSGSA